MCSEATTRKQHQLSQEDWDQAKEKWNEFSQKFSARMSESRVWGQRADRHMVAVKLPNGREFSFTLGHLILFGLALWLLPFNLIILGALLWLAYTFGGDHDSRKRKNDTEDKPKRKTDEPDSDFEVFRV